MIKNWIQEIFLQDNQLIITEMSKRYSLSNEEYSNLINLMLYYYSITTFPNTLEAVTFICNEIQKYKEEIEKNQNCHLFESCISEFLKQELEKNGNLQKTGNFLNEGFVFHSFNAAFLDTINSKGLIAKEKPWNLEEVEMVRSIFQKKNQKNIFGLYQGRSETPIFFANNLTSSAYYGLSSPTFFRKFIENKPKYFNVFLNRDFNKASESIEEVCNGLSSEEKDTVFEFFHKYWNIFTSEKYPCIAISTKEKLGVDTTPLQRRDNEDDFRYYLRQILDTKNIMLHQDIPRESLEIFSYQSFSFVSNINKKTY